MEVNEIYQVFKDYFGEAYVDIQQNSDIKTDLGIYLSDKTVILVHWPTVTVTNEFDQSIEIWDLYSATFIDTASGKMYSQPEFNRSTYDEAQWESNYLHSHVLSIDKTQIEKFQISCLGSGPIRNTIARLGTTEGCSDLNIWNLYCWELDKYVTVESLAGVPYKKLMNVGGHSRESYSDIFIRPTLGSNEFLFRKLVNTLITYIIKHNVLQYAYRQGVYTLATNVTDTVLNISNAFIEMYNSDADLRKQYPIDYLNTKEFINTKIIINGCICDKIPNDRNIRVMAGRKLFTFKGEDVCLRLKEQQQNYTESNVILVNKNIIDNIIYRILKYINLKYGRAEIISNKKIRVV